MAEIEYIVTVEPTDVFAIPFSFWKKEDLTVTLNGNQTTAFAAYPDEDEGGGFIQLDVPVTQTTVKIVRTIACDRVSSFPVNGPFRIEALNSELNRIIAKACDLEDLFADPEYVIDWENIENKPTEYPPTAHTHTEADVTDLNRIRYVGDWVSGPTYLKNDMARQSGFVGVALADTTDQVAPVQIVNPTYLYSGADPTSIASSVKQIIFGTRYTVPADKTINALSVRVYTITGNIYTVYSVTDRGGDTLVSQIAQFEAQSTGWQEINKPEVYISGGSIFDVIAVTYEPAPVPTTFDLTMTYSTPQNAGVPAVGEIQHDRSVPSIMHIDDFDAQLAGLATGDVINGAGQSWVIQTITYNPSGYYVVNVAPAQNGSPTGSQVFTFETTVPADITYLSDTGYWSGASEVQGLYGADIDYEQIVPDQNAYGVDIEIGEVQVSDDWALISTSSTSFDNSGGSEFPEAPQDGLTYGRANAVWERVVSTAGDSMTGNLSMINGARIRYASNVSNYILFQNDDDNREGSQMVFGYQYADARPDLDRGYMQVSDGPGAVANRVVYTFPSLNSTRTPDDVLRREEIEATWVALDGSSTMTGGLKINGGSFSDIFLSDNAGVVGDGDFLWKITSTNAVLSFQSRPGGNTFGGDFRGVVDPNTGEVTDLRLNLGAGVSQTDIPSEQSLITKARLDAYLQGTGDLEHATLLGLDQDDHTQYVMGDGTRSSARIVLDSTFPNLTLKTPTITDTNEFRFYAVGDNAGLQLFKGGVGSGGVVIIVDNDGIADPGDEPAVIDIQMTTGRNVEEAPDDTSVMTRQRGDSRYSQSKSYATWDEMRTDTSQNVVMCDLLWQGRVLRFRRDDAVTNAARTRDDGVKFSPAEQAHPFHFGAYGDLSVDDAPALNTMIAWLDETMVAGGTAPGPFYDGKLYVDGEGGVYRCESTVKFLQNRRWIIDNLHLVAYGQGFHNATRIEESFLFWTNGNNSTITNLACDCNRLSNGVYDGSGRNRYHNYRAIHMSCDFPNSTWSRPITRGHGFNSNYSWGFYVPDDAERVRAGETRLVNANIYQWINSDAEFADANKFTCNLVEINNSDCKVEHCNLNWGKTSYAGNGGFHLLYGCHIVNGKGEQAENGWSSCNDPSILSFGRTSYTEAVTQSPSGSLYLYGCYLDNGICEYWTDKVRWDNCLMLIDGDDVILTDAMHRFYASSNGRRLRCQGDMVFGEWTNDNHTDTSPPKIIALFDSTVPGGASPVSWQTGAYDMARAINAEVSDKTTPRSMDLLKVSVNSHRTIDATVDYKSIYAQALSFAEPRNQPPSIPVNQTDGILAVATGNQVSNGFGSDGAGLYEYRGGSWHKI